MPSKRREAVECVELTAVDGEPPTNEPPTNEARADAPGAEAQHWWWGSRRAMLAAALLVGLAVGGAVGYIAGDHRRSDTTSGAAGPTGAATSSVSVEASPTVPPALTIYALEQTGYLCGVQTGARTLQLGIGVVNHGAAVVTLDQVTASLPLGGLRLTSVGVGSACGQVQPMNPLNGFPIGPGREAFLLATFDLLTDDCPRPLPVRFNLTVRVNGVASTIPLAGFADLGNIALASC